MGVLKVGALDVSPSPSLPREKLGVGSSLRIPCHCSVGGVYGESLSQSFLPGSKWAFPCSFDVYEGFGWFPLSEGISPHVAVHPVCLWKEGSWEVSLCHHLGQLPLV